jgi:hypothetical protein
MHSPIEALRTASRDQLGCNLQVRTARLKTRSANVFCHDRFQLSTDNTNSGKLTTLLLLTVGETLRCHAGSITSGACPIASPGTAERQRDCSVARPSVHSNKE